MQLAKGDRIPPATLKDQDGRKVSLSKFKGRPLVLYFYPADESQGCTKQVQYLTLSKVLRFLGSQCSWTAAYNTSLLYVMHTSSSVVSYYTSKNLWGAAASSFSWTSLSSLPLFSCKIQFSFQLLDVIAYMQLWLPPVEPNNKCRPVLSVTLMSSSRKLVLKLSVSVVIVLNLIRYLMQLLSAIWAYTFIKFMCIFCLLVSLVRRTSAELELTWGFPWLLLEQK